MTNPALFMPRIEKLRDDGTPIVTKQKMIITEMTTDFQHQPYKNVAYKFQAVDEVRKGSVPELRAATDSFKKYINEHDVALFYHNKDEKDCKYCPQNHVHMLVK